MTVIELTDTTQDMVFKMSEGNPGAVSVIMQMLAEGGKIDPDDWMPGLGGVLSLDSMGIRGSKIWMLYKDVCGENLTKMLAVMRARQLGFIAEEKIISAINGQGSLDVDDLHNQVCERLEDFQKPE